MSIKTLVEDAVFLRNNGRYLGALSLLVLAIAGSARKMFPKGETRSLKNPKDFMRDEESFTLFLGGRLNKIINGDLGGPDAGESNFIINFRGEDTNLATILYKYYRCQLVHEAALPKDIEFAPQNDEKSSSLVATISLGEKLTLGCGWIDVLLAAIVKAKCNNDIFGKSAPEMVANEGVDAEAHLLATVKKYEITRIGYKLLRHGLSFIIAEGIDPSDPNVIGPAFAQLFRDNKLMRGGIPALHGFGLSNSHGLLTPKGIFVIDEILQNYHLE